MLIDTFKRKIDYLRVSLTKQCNFRCQYCMPDTPDDFFDNTAISLPKLLEFIKIAIDNGITKIRITGGEPLLRADIAEFIAGIYTHKNDVEIALTTNGFLLEKFAKSLKDAGLRRINISLDSLKAERIKTISKRDALPQILRGIESAQNVGLGVKLNMVALAQTRDEICDMLKFGRERGILVRFIEFMENTHANSQLIALKSSEILETIASRYKITPLFKEHFGPARLFTINAKAKDGRAYAFGIIAPHEDDFCASCNRIRLTSEGVLCPCLFYQDSVNAREAILSGDKEAMSALLKQAVFNKPEKNQWSGEELKVSERAFYHTGG
ncbi:GTP 3',8-cyclase MoaA [uncultured Helicobacter sp.]|uniref:GTP 3',8-cyclase MoaA n=1 Tax=uncultured Helicobacter sp. TaxID=175537 RepID=UPI001C39A877|nr:GTP 3',8-cyclase MoaA [Candidatus Helicobacter avicola]